MKLLSTTDLGIKALIYMTLDPDDISYLSDMSKIFQTKTTTFKRPFMIFLKNKVINSHVGRGGGFSLACNPSELFLGEIIKMLEKQISIISWMKSNKNVNMESLRSTYQLAIEEAETSFFLTLNRYTIADLSNNPLTQQALKISHLVQK